MSERPPEFYVMVDAIHDAAIYVQGCKHPKFKPSECAQIADLMWEAGVRLASPAPRCDDRCCGDRCLKALGHEGDHVFEEL